MKSEFLMWIKFFEFLLLFKLFLLLQQLLHQGSSQCCSLSHTVHFSFENCSNWLSKWINQWFLQYSSGENILMFIECLNGKFAWQGYGDLAYDLYGMVGRTYEWYCTILVFLISCWLWTVRHYPGIFWWLKIFVTVFE